MGEESGISVIIPNYNTGRYLREAVDSVYAQNIQNPFEVIVIDDGSKDRDTPRVLAEIEELYPNLRVIRHERNMGLSAARNTGLEAAQHRYIFPLDSDDILSTDKRVLNKGNYLDLSIQALENDPDVVFAFCDNQAFGAARRYIKRDYDEKAIPFHHNIGCMIVFRRDEGIAAGGYDTDIRHAEDWTFIMALVNQRIKNRQAAETQHFDKPFYMYRMRGDGTNMCSNPAMSVPQILAVTTQKYPELYQKYYPGVAGDELIDRLIHEQKVFSRQMRTQFALNCLAHPVTAFHQGDLNRVANKIGRELSKIWHRVAGGNGNHEPSPEHVLAP